MLQQPAEPRLATDVDETDCWLDGRLLATAFLGHRQVVVDALMRPFLVEQDDDITPILRARDVWLTRGIRGLDIPRRAAI